jgi:hypothetical protein
MKYSRIDELLSISSGPLCGEPTEMPELFASFDQGPSLIELLKLKNGFFAFESALHVFPARCRIADEMDIETWNRDDLWRDAYGELTRGLLFFAEDIFQDQFCLSERGILRFKAETAETVLLAASLEEWADRILIDHRNETGWPFSREWQTKNGPLPSGKRLMPKTPFFLGGEYKLDNLWLGHSVEGMRFKGDLAIQTQNLTDGSSVKLHFTLKPGEPNK